MSGQDLSNTVMVCCSVFRDEVETLRKQHWPGAIMACQDSMLHMRPQVLAGHLKTVVDPLLAGGRKVVLIYGDCCLAMAELTARPNVVRTRGNNCCEILLGHEQYKQLSHQGAFFLFPEWTGRWREVFTRHLGLTRENATYLLADMHRKLIYLDTGVVPAPLDTLQDCSQYCGLPYEVRVISLEPLRQAIGEALERLQTAKTEGIGPA